MRGSGVSLWSVGYPGTHCVDQAGLKLTEFYLASTSQVLGWKACATTTKNFWFQWGKIDPEMMSQPGQDDLDCYHGNVQCSTLFLFPIFYWNCCKPFEDTVEVSRPLSFPVWSWLIKLLSYLLWCLRPWLVLLEWVTETNPLDIPQNEDFDLMCTLITRS